MSKLPSKDDILNWVSENPTKSTKRDIARAFGIKGAARIDLKRILKELDADGALPKKKKRFRDPDRLPPVSVLQVGVPDGNGDLFARPLEWQGDGPEPKLLMITKPADPALGEGDRILARLTEVRGEDHAYEARLIRKIRSALGGSEAGKKIAVLGLTFKPETDDMRDAPALAILPALVEKGAIVRAHDPQGIEEAKPLLPDGVQYDEDAYAAIDGADAIVLMTEWNVYRGLDLARVRDLMSGRVFVDLRNVYEPADMEAAGFEYTGVGR